MSKLKKIIKGLIIFIIVLLMLPVLALLALQTPFAKAKLAEFAEKQLNEMLNAELTIGKIEGNFISKLNVADILLMQENDTVAYLEKIGLKYRLTALLKSEILVEEVNIASPLLLLVQHNDSTWNFAKLMKPTPDEPEDSDSEFGMKINLKKITLTDGKIKIDALNQKIPKKISDLFVQINGHYAAEDIALNITEFRFFTENPELELQNLSLGFNLKNGILKLDDFLLKTSRNMLTANAVFDPQFKKPTRFELSANSIDADEFRAFLPDNFTLLAKPDFSLEATIEDEISLISASLTNRQQWIKMQFSSLNISEFIAHTDSVEPDYELQINMQNLNPNEWITLQPLNSVLNGKLNLKGKGREPSTMNTSVNADLSGSVLYAQAFRNLLMGFQLNSGDISGKATASGNFGSLEIISFVHQFTSKFPAYNLQLVTQNFDISPFTQKPEYATSLNIDAKVSGSGFDPKKMHANANIAAQNSMVAGIPLHSFLTDLNFRNNNVLINKLHTATETIDLEISGNYHLNDYSSLQMALQITDASEISLFTGIDSIETAGKITANLHGTPAKMNIDALMNLYKTRYTGYKIDTLTFIADGILQNFNKVYMKANANARGLDISGIAVNELQLDAVTNIDTTGLKLKATADEMYAQLNTLVAMGEKINIGLSDILFRYRERELKQNSETAHITIAENDYRIDSLHLLSEGNNGMQDIFIHGIVDRKGEQNFIFDIKNAELEKWLPLFAPEQDIKGLANIKALLTGNAAAPALTAFVNLDGTTYEDYRLDTLNANMLIADGLMQMKMHIVPQDKGRFMLQANAPANIRIDSMQFALVPAKTDSIQAKLNVTRFPLAVLNMFVASDKLEGYLESDMKVTGTIENPQPSGNLMLKDGIFQFKQYGIDYPEMSADILFDPDRIRLNDFLIRSKKGKLTASGDMRFNSQFYNAELNNSEIDIVFDRFQPFAHRQFNMELNGNAGLRGNSDSLRFSGDINIPSSEFYLPAVLALMGKAPAPDIIQPLLVTELEKMQPGDSVVVRINPTDTTKKSENNILDKLRGKMRVRIPRNTWIKNEDMRIELSGDVDVLKNSDFFEIFGSVDVVRGQYNMLGKVFVIKNGVITFTGGENINPMLDVSAVYTFRDREKVLRELLLSVNGEATAPEIRFTLDEKALSEGDALSYIIFGTSMDELGTSQQQGLSEGIDALGMAQTAAASVLSSQLTKLLGNTFNVDYVEFKTGSSFDSGSFIVGKYITNKLFMSYERNFGQHTGNKDISEYEMKMEYELFRFLFLQLTASPLRNGIDLIFKVNAAH